MPAIQGQAGDDAQPLGETSWRRNGEAGREGRSVKIQGLPSCPLPLVFSRSGCFPGSIVPKPLVRAMQRLLRAPALWGCAAAAASAAAASWALVRGQAAAHLANCSRARADRKCSRVAAAAAAAARSPLPGRGLRLCDTDCLPTVRLRPAHALAQASRQPALAEAAPASSALSPDEWRSFKLVHKQWLTTGVANPTIRYRFELPDKSQPVGGRPAGRLLLPCAFSRRRLPAARPPALQAIRPRPQRHPPPQVGLPVASCLLVRAPIGKVKEDGSRAWVIR